MLLEPNPWEPIADGAIPEDELRSHLQYLWNLRKDEPFREPNPLRLIKGANYLRKLGRDKSLLVLKEYCRVTALHDHEWPYWLIRVLYKPKTKDGFFPRPGIGATGVECESSAKWPTAPILWSEGLPFNLFRGALLRGSPEFPYTYIEEHEKEWRMRTKDIVPSDDPFAAYEKAVDSPLFPFPRKVDGDRFVVPYWEDEGYVLREVLMMVGSVYKPEEFWNGREGYYVNGRDYDKFHREFLELHAHWDNRAQAYVTGTGSRKH